MQGIHASAALATLLLASIVQVPASAGDNTARVARQADRGALDPTFGQEGVVVTDVGGRETGYVIAVGSRIVTAGRMETDAGASDLVLVGFDADGSLDPTFGNEGVVVTDFGGFDSPADMQIDSQGRVLVLIGVGDSTDTRGAALVRYLEDGTLDDSFGDGGFVDIGTDLYPVRVVLQPDGKIVVASLAPVVLARYLPDGTLDPAFGENGRVVTSLGTPNDWPVSLSVLPDGKLLVVASTTMLVDDFDGTFKLALVRYRRGGSLDRSFSDDGIARRRIPDWHDVVDAEVDDEGRIVVLVSGGGGSAYCATEYVGQNLRRFRGNGKPDPTFGRRGVARVSTLNVRAVALQARGRILVAGEGCMDPENPAIKLAFSLARFRPDGSLDRNFGDKGTTVNLIAGQHAVPNDLTLQSNDRVLLFGNTVSDSPFTGDDLAVARYVAA